ncbi:MAG TPA: hypothetical protein VFB45_04640 [Pseudolabrys sp.]|nr:hypothetical protein [Pseudolabrys sp.]
MAAPADAAITWWAVASAFGGTIIGSVLGGSISYWLQRRALAATKAQHDADRKEARKALGYALFFKLIRATSSLAQIGKPIAEALERLKKEGVDEDLWPRVQGIVPLPAEIKFSPEEMALILSLDNKLFNDVAALDEIHNNTVAIFRRYSEKRDALTATLTPAAMNGNLGAVLLTKEQSAQIKPRSVELDILIRGMAQAYGDAKKAWQCVKGLHSVLEKEFDLKHKLELKEGYALDDVEVIADTPGSKSKRVIVARTRTSQL